MPRITEGGLVFDFPQGWQAVHFDETAFHRRFQKMQDGIKALDIIAIAPNGVCWLMEIKDYRRYRRTRAVDLADEVVIKVICSLASLLPAKLNANDAQESAFAAAVLGAKRLRVCLHLEQPRNPSRLFPRSVDPADVLQKLRQKLKPIDPHPRIFSGDQARGWRVEAARF